MRRALLLSLAIAFALACGDNITEPVPERSTPLPPVSFATTTTEDGLSISTDKDDYQPGDVVHLTGSGWEPGDILDIVLTDDPLTHEPHRWSVTVGPDGTFHDQTYVVEEGDLNVTFTLVATSRATGRSLTVVFTDGNPRAPTVGAQSPSPVIAGNTATYLVTVPFEGNTANCTVTLSAAQGTSPAWPAPPSGGFFSFSATSVTGSNGSNPTSTLTVTAPPGMAAGTYRFTLSATPNQQPGEECQGNNNPRTSASINFVVAANQPPSTPASLAQFRSDGTTSISVGGATNQTSVVLKGAVSDPNLGNTVRLQVEVKPLGTAFTNTPTAESGLVTSGTTASVTVGSLVNATSYHWQARAVDNNGAASAWVSFSGNAETAADFSVDTDALTVTINEAAGQADPTNASPINFTVAFSKAVSDFASGDVTLGGTAGATTATVTGSGTTYNVAVSGMTTDGTVIASIAAGVATDAAGNANEASGSTDNTVTYDKTKPTVTINQAATQADPTNASPINFTVEFSEPVTGFTAGGVTVTGTASTSAPTVTGTGATYNVAIPVTTDGTVIASVAAGAATDLAGNLNVASTSTDNAVTYDKTPPAVTINQAAGQADPTNASPINFTVVFSETVADFATGDITVSGTAGATTAQVTGSGTNYNVAVSGMTNTGTVVASVAASVASDAAGNGNLASTSTDNTVTYDAAPPVVSNVTVDPDPTNGSIDVTATAKVDDAATGNSTITAAYYRIDNGPEVAMAAVDGGFNSATENVTATITAATVAALSEGNHQVCVRGTDQAGNSSSFDDAGACVTLRIDKQPPVVSNVTVSPNLTNGSIAVLATATVDDAETGSSRIVAAWYSIDGGAAQSMTADDGSFSEASEVVKATIPASVVNALEEGPHTVCVQGKDLAGNLSSFSASGACATLQIDKTPPEVTINKKVGQADPTNALPIDFTVVFTENVTDFATGDVTLSGPAAVGATATVTGSGTTYNVAVSGLTIDGALVASIAGGVAHDAAGNGNNASTSTDNSVVYDKTPPVVSCGTADGNWHAVDVSIGCTATDATSGLADPADASFSLSTSVAAGTETANALTSSRTVLDNAGNSSAAGPISGNKVDKKAPQVALTCPVDLVILNASVNANWTATDGGSGVAPSGTVPLVTNSIGSKTASVTVPDNVGNSTSSSCGYTVGYNFSGFFAPVDRPNTMNVSKVGQAIPLKWRLTDASGRPVTDVTSVSVQAVNYSCGLTVTQDLVEEYASGSSGLQNLGDGYYQFNWKTPSNYLNSCKSITLVFGAGGGYTEKPSAFFTFKK